MPPCAHAQLEEIKDEEALLDPSDSEVDGAAEDGAAEDGEAERELPILELVQAELERIFEDVEEFDIDEFMEGDTVASYSKEHVEDVLKALAAKRPAPLMIDQGEYPPYKKPRTL